VGAFVDPDEEETKASNSTTRKRIFGIGIMNNIVIGIVTGILVLAMFSMVVVVPGVHVYDVVANGPANLAGIGPDFVITSVNNIDVNSGEEILAIMNGTESSTISGYYKDGGIATYVVDGTSLGVATVNVQAFMSVMDSNVAPLLLMVSPVAPTIAPGSPISVFAFGGSSESYFVAPFTGFWFLLRLAFWTFWINIAVGLSNAIPALPFDGGLIIHEYIKPVCKRIGIENYSMHVTGLITVILLGMLVGVILLPHLFHLGG
jgi:membrane-associated protease RseP (regulator of RpoE activity)